MMTYFLDTHLDSGEFYSPTTNPPANQPRAKGRDDIHLLNEKLEIPRHRGLIERPRLEDMLRKSVSQFPATLISGRAGTGKTAMAADFARPQEHAAWYSVESSDVEWNVFSHYFAACVLRAVGSEAELQDVLPSENEPSQSAIATFLITVLAEAETALVHDPFLIVLDGIHHLFDASWFGEFFSLLLNSLPENTSLLLLCRSKPPNPLWRMRSKQQLNVIDEKLLAFNLSETLELTAKLGLKRTDAERAHAETFGRVSKLLQLVGSAKPVKPRS